MLLGALVRAVVSDHAHHAFLLSNARRIHAEAQGMDYFSAAYSCGRCRRPHRQTLSSSTGMETATNTQRTNLDAESPPPCSDALIHDRHEGTTIENKRLSQDQTDGKLVNSYQHHWHTSTHHYS